jgi:hypothetical protein
MKRNIASSLFIGSIGVLLLLIVVGAAGAAGGGKPIGSRMPDRSLAPASTSISSTFTYQGQLKNGSNAVTSVCNLNFGLYDAPSGGVQIGITQTIQSHSVLNGLFTVILNGDGEFGATPFNGQARWLQISVKCTNDLGVTDLSPRQPLMAAPYALSLMPNATINGITQTVLSVNISSTDDLATAIEGRVTNPDASPSSAGVAGTNEGLSGGIGVFGGSESGSGVFGLSDTGTGVDGSSNSGAGVSARSIGGYGIFAISADGDGVHGVSTNGIGVYGTAPVTAVLGTSTAPTGTGVYGISNGELGTGVIGYATSTTGEAWGVSGQSDSNNGRGVTGYAASLTGTTYGVYAHAESPSGYGIYAVAPLKGALAGATAEGGVGLMASGYTGVSAEGLFTGVLGSAFSPSGTGVLAYNEYVTGTALAIMTGTIRVMNMGEGTATPVFIQHVFGSGNTCDATAGGSSVDGVVIDNPLTNDDPNAVLFVMPVGYVGSTPPPSVFVAYDVSGTCGTGRWVIITTDNSSIESVAKNYNVLVVKP